MPSRKRTPIKKTETCKNCGKRMKGGLFGMPAEKIDTKSDSEDRPVVATEEPNKELPPAQGQAPAPAQGQAPAQAPAQAQAQAPAPAKPWWKFWGGKRSKSRKSKKSTNNKSKKSKK